MRAPRSTRLVRWAAGQLRPDETAGSAVGQCVMNGSAVVYVYLGRDDDPAVVYRIER